MSLLQMLLRFVMGVRPPERLVWAQDVWNALMQGGPLEMKEVDLLEEVGLSGSSARACRLANKQLSVRYMRSEVNGELRETLDMFVMAQKKGGLIVCFTNGKALSWNRPSAHSQYEIKPRENYWYAQILLKVRKAT